MTNRIFEVARRGFSSCSNSKLTAPRLPVSRPLKLEREVHPQKGRNFRDCLTGSLGINNSVGQSNIQRREWSYAASVLSHKPNAQKSRKTVSRDERRAMVESFVNNYRAENAGKFPKVCDTMKQVGGSYYVVRKIIQELEYRSKMDVSNGMDENLVGKGLLNQEKLLTTETVKVSLDNTEAAIDMPVQDDRHLVDLEDKDIVSVDHEHLKEEIGSLTSSWESSTSQEAIVTNSLRGPFIEPECNLLERDAAKPSQSSLHMPNDVKTVEVQSSCSHSVAPEGPLPDEEVVHLSVPFSPKAGSSQSKTESLDSEFADMENHLIMEEECVQKSGYERRKQALECLPEEPSLSTLQMLDDVKTEQAESISPGSVASDSYLPKEAIEQPSGSYSQAQSLDSEFVDMENHLISEEKGSEKSRHGRGEQAPVGDLPIMDYQKHKTERFQGSSDLDESKTDYSKREISDTEKSTLWKNLKSFADGILNIWRKL